ncbi:hypothetical protein [Brevundimonas naejangsanensis]|uniref:hypothetical protein n=1 Tax=Brevundimonas naejangsanensis TaxID=588932 RepID=UPI0026EF6BDC|nr:hypothetical protein [Brevundimonas naejangsanensis]
MDKPTKDADGPGAEPAVPSSAAPAASAKAERAAQLAAALRANLRRRKAPGAGGARPAKDSN